ncbi:MAG: polysaccharide pyruvyl transferase CsaB [Selenomonadaceae bacterium]|nr:polysaccharide pyruvyl transferase CsaB [Selenomonadaceae bacterium]
MNILISGYYGSKNGGDEAMLAAMLEVLREMDDDLKFTVISLNPEYTRKRHNVDAVKWLDIFSIIRKFFWADLLISGGGSLLQNVTSRSSLYYYLGIIFLAKIFGCKVMLYAQGIGPIRGGFACWLMKFIVNRVDMVTVRDKGSLEELKRLKIFLPKIFCTADPVLAIKPVTLEIGTKILSRHSLKNHVGKFIGISVRRWINWNKCQNELADALNRLAAQINAKIIFIPMQFPEDVKAARSTAELVKIPCTVIDEELTTAEVMSLVGCMDVLISIRLHALVFAGVMGVPMIGISYDPKIDRFLDSIEEKPLGTLDDVTADKIFNETLKKLEEGTFKNDSLLNNLRELAVKNAQLAIELLKSVK